MLAIPTFYFYNKKFSQKLQQLKQNMKVMIETAKRIKANGIVTRNVKDYSKSPVKIYRPSEFIGNILG